MKKFLSVVVTVIMLLSLCGMQSFAFTIKLPTVTSAKFVEATPVSMKELDSAKELIDESIEYLTEEFGISIEEFKEQYGDIFGDTFENTFYKFYIGGDILELTLSDESVIELDIDDGYYEIDDYTVVSAEAYVSYDEYLRVKEENADTINITVDCEVYSNISGISKESQFTLEAELVDCFLKGFAPVSVIDYSLYEDSDTLDLEGKKFLVTYADGTVKTLTAEYDPVEEEYMLGDELLWVVLGEDTALITYMDEIYKHSVSFDEENPYESIEITDYDFSETEGLKSVTYKITDKNGRSDSFTADMTPYLDDGLYPFYGVYVNVYDSYYVRIGCDEVMNTETYETEAVDLYAAIGDVYSESVKLDYIEITEEKDFLAKLEEIIATILTVFFNIISFFDAESVA